MAYVVFDRVLETCTTTGTSNFTLAGSTRTGYRTFASVLAAGDTFDYVIRHADLAEWEVGVGTYSTNTLERTTVKASSTGAKVSFSSGDKEVFIGVGAHTILDAVHDSVVARNNVRQGVASTATAAGTTTLTLTSKHLQIFTGTTTQTVQLPAANAGGAGIGVEFVIKNRSTDNLTVSRAGSDTIEGATSIVLTSGQAVTLVSDGASEWEFV